MIINTNLASLNTIRQLSINEKATQSSLAKLSSGLRINTAADDAAGLAISEKMRGQISGLNQASSNAQNGINLVGTAEGALNETTSILQRMRELAVQSSNDTNTDQDRTNIQTEMTQLEKEVDRISNTTQFNTKNLLDGSMGTQVSSAVKNINTSDVLFTSGAKVSVTTATLASLQDSNSNSLGIAGGDKITISYVVNGTLTTASTIVHAATTTIGTLDTMINSGTIATTSTGALTITASTAGTAGAIEGLTLTVTDSSGNVKTAATDALSSFTETTAASDKRADGTATLLIGANGGQSLKIDINNMGAQALGVNNLKVDTQAGANVAIKVIDNAIQKVSAERAKLGAFQNRLDHTINNLGTASQNLTAAEASIRDVDMASEMTNFQKNNILQQAAQAMLAQANQQPQGVLQLLR